MFVAAPGCPRGYTGPGGISDFGRYEGCTGGIYRYIDVKVFGEEHIYHGSAVTYVYHGNNFECEGLMGLLNAIFLVYLGTLVTPVIQKVKKPMNRVWTYAVTGLLFIGGLLCGFKQYDGYMPINKNKWNTTFICITGGTGFVVFALVYLLVDVWKVWSGYPVKAMGMNSILIYIVHEFVHGYMPFTYEFETVSHWTEMTNSLVLGVGMWVFIANVFYRRNLFFSIFRVCYKQRNRLNCHTRWMNRPIPSSCCCCCFRHRFRCCSYFHCHCHCHFRFRFHFHSRFHCHNHTHFHCRCHSRHFPEGN